MKLKIFSIFSMFVFCPYVLAEGGLHTSSPITSVLFGILVILIVANIAGQLAEKLGQPSVLGELFVGILLGHLYLIDIDAFEFLKIDFSEMEIVNFSNSEHCAGVVITVMSQLGVILLLFMVGLKTSIAEMRRVGWSALTVGTSGVLIPLLLGWGTSTLLLPDKSWSVHMFIGATLAATSIGITARVIDDLDKTSTVESKIILGASVIDDIVGLLILAVIQGMIISMSGGSSSINLAEIAAILAKAFIFLGVALFFGQAASRWLLKCCNLLHGKNLLLVSGLVFCFALSWVADYAGLATIIGAFSAGLILDKKAYGDYSEQHHEVELIKVMQPIRDLFVPIFFVLMGIHVDLTNMFDFSVLSLAMMLVIVAIIGKLLCSLTVFEKHVNRLSIGIGMIPRGEVGLIFAAIGRQLEIGGEPVISSGVYTALVIMVFITTMVTPPMLKWSFINKN